MTDKEPDPPRFSAPELGRPGDTVTLSPDQSRHLALVLRLKAGDRVRAFDGRGAECVCVVRKADSSETVLSIESVASAAPSADVRLTLAFAPAPGQRTDTLIEKTTELGIHRLRPLVCDRLQDFQAKAIPGRIERWRRKARDAARQSQRRLVPEILKPVLFEDFVSADKSDLRLIGSTEEVAPLWTVLSGTRSRLNSATMIVGPAGGFTRREVDIAEAASFQAVSLGPHVLRVETAAIAFTAGVVQWLNAGAGEADPT